MKWRIAIGSVATTSLFVHAYDTIRSLIIDHTAGLGSCPACVIARLEVTSNRAQSKFAMAYTAKGPAAETHRFSQLISMSLPEHHISVWSLVDVQHLARLAQYLNGTLTVETAIPSVLTTRIEKDEVGIVMSFDQAQLTQMSAQSALLSLLPA